MAAVVRHFCTNGAAHVHLNLNVDGAVWSQFAWVEHKRCVVDTHACVQCREHQRTQSCHTGHAQRQRRIISTTEHTIDATDL